MACCGNGSKKEGNTVDTTEINWGASRQQQSKNNFKVVFLGKSGVGKTSVTLRFCRDTFQDGTEATIGASFLTKMMTVGNRAIRFEMWDTAGQERYRALAPMYYRNADAAVLVYDITDKQSFEALKSWYAELQKNVPDCIIVLAGNKSDLPDRGVSTSTAQEYANQVECPLLEVSSKTGHLIPDLFTQLANSLTAKYPK